jgi:murein DD-endopeptidase MepM/ murein hydrolase activator NlpD
VRALLVGLSVAMFACEPAASAPALVPAVSHPADAAPAHDARALTPVAGFARPLARMEDDYESLAGSLAGSSGLPAFSGRLANWPISGTITSPFGPRWGGFHTGLDIAAPMGTPVIAAAAGEVVTVGKPYLAYGDTATIVIIAHGKDFATAYVHLNDGRPPIVKPGQFVRAGEVIAYCGSTGFSTGPHLHFMTIANGRMVDPIPYLP